MFPQPQNPKGLNQDNNTTKTPTDMVLNITQLAQQKLESLKQQLPDHLIGLASLDNSNQQQSSGDPNSNVSPLILQPIIPTTTTNNNNSAGLQKIAGDLRKNDEVQQTEQQRMLEVNDPEAVIDSQGLVENQQPDDQEMEIQAQEQKDIDMAQPVASGDLVAEEAPKEEAIPQHPKAEDLISDSSSDQSSELDDDDLLLDDEGLESNNDPLMMLLSGAGSSQFTGIGGQTALTDQDFLQEVDPQLKEGYYNYDLLLKDVPKLPYEQLVQVQEKTVEGDLISLTAGEKIMGSYFVYTPPFLVLFDLDQSLDDDQEKDQDQDLEESQGSEQKNFEKENKLRKEIAKITQADFNQTLLVPTQKELMQIYEQLMLQKLPKEPILLWSDLKQKLRNIFQ